MIIHGDKKLEVGKIYTKDILDKDRVWRKTPFMVIAEVTKEDLIKYAMEEGVMDRLNVNTIGPFYYRISID